MVGWSRRNSESAERRRRWWASLTDEEKAFEVKREKVGDRVLYYAFAIILVLLLGALAIPLPWMDQHKIPVVGVLLAVFPGGLILAAFVAIYKMRQVK